MHPTFAADTTVMLKDKLYSKIGELTIQFATLEHRLQSLLKMLVGKDNDIIGPFFIHELNLYVLMRKVRLIASYRLRDRPQLLEDLERTLKRIDVTRDLRNLLVHGDWQIDEGCTSCPVHVRDFKIKYENGQWQELTETTFNEKKLTHLTRRLHADSLEIDHLIRRIQNNE
jgi:hypothetical protein